MARHLGRARERQTAVREEGLNPCPAGPFRIAEGEDVWVLYSPDVDRQYMREVPSSGYPLQVLELHSKDDVQAVATVFSYKVGARFVIAFRFADVRPL